MRPTDALPAPTLPLAGGQANHLVSAGQIAIETAIDGVVERETGVAEICGLSVRDQHGEQRAQSAPPITPA